MKTASTLFLLLISSLVQAGDFAFCKGSVLQRRFALVQFGRFMDAYIVAKGELPDICSAPVAEILDGIPDLLKGNSVCGSSREAAVYYSCQIPSAPSDKPSENSPLEDSPVIESCRYSLLDQSVSCENRSVITTLGG